MTDLANQKRMAADLLDCGENRVWLDPNAQGDVAEAITREDVRELIDRGVIREKPKQGVSRGRARERDAKRSDGHQKGPGTRSGTAGARNPAKEDWQSTVRALRDALKEMRDDGELSPSQYRDLYRRVKGGEFDSVRRLETHVATLTED